MGEYNIHEPLVGGSSVLKAKVCDIVLVVAMIKHKVCFGSVQGVHTNLVIPGVCIHET